MPIAVLEVDGLVANTRQPLRLAFGPLAILRMNELDERLRAELLQIPAERPLPGRVEALEVAVEAGRAEQVARDLPEPVALGRQPSQMVSERTRNSAEDEEGQTPAHVVDATAVIAGVGHGPYDEQSEREHRGRDARYQSQLDRDDRDRQHVEKCEVVEAFEGEAER